MKVAASLPVTAALLLILVAVAAAALLWLAFQAAPRPAPSKPCSLTLDAFREVVIKIDSVKYAYALEAWLRSLDCDAKIDKAYLLYPDGTLAAPLTPLETAKLKMGAVRQVELYALEPIEPGDYVLRVPAVRGDDLLEKVRVEHRVASSVIRRGVYLEDINNTVEHHEGYDIVYLVRVYQAEYGTYNLTVLVCAQPGYTVHFVRIEVLNATLEPPMWLGPYHVFVEQPRYLPFTYPDCSVANFYPIQDFEQPLTILVNVYATPSQS